MCSLHTWPTSLWRLLQDGLHTSSLLMGIGGVVLLVGVGYDYRSDSSIESPPRRLVWLTAIGAALATIGALAAFLG